MQDFVHQQYYPKPKYLIIGSFGPLGILMTKRHWRAGERGVSGVPAAGDLAECLLDQTFLEHHSLDPPSTLYQTPKP